MTKATLFLFLLFNVFCIISPMNYSKGHSSRSKEKKEKESFELRCCKMQLFLEFKKNTGLGNFLHALINLDENSFSEYDNKESPNLVKNYYFDLLHTFLDIDLPEILNPEYYCRIYHGRETYDCISAIEGIGCKANDNGTVCIEHLYFNWKRKEQNVGAINGTKDLSDQDLLNALCRGSGLISDFPDNILLKDYYRVQRDLQISRASSSTHNTPDEGLNEDDQHEIIQFPDEELWDEVHRTDPESYSQYLEYRQLQRDLYEARYRTYGIRNVSYADVYREYMRRQSLPKQFDDNYAMYLHNKIAHIEYGPLNDNASRFKNRSEYCKEYLSE